MSQDTKITIKYKEKEYQIEPKVEIQKVKPKSAKENDQEITVKDYQPGKWNHTCQCSENGSNFEKVKIKWGSGKHITIWGGSSIALIGILFSIYWFFYRKKQAN